VTWDMISGERTFDAKVVRSEVRLARRLGARYTGDVLVNLI
jgi:hypothetical protein